MTDFYKSDRPPQDDSILSGGLGYNFESQIALQSAGTTRIGGGSGASYNKQRSGATAQPFAVTIKVCVGGTEMSLDVLAIKGPY